MNSNADAHFTSFRPTLLFQDYIQVQARIASWAREEQFPTGFRLAWKPNYQAN